MTKTISKQNSTHIEGVRVVGSSTPLDYDEDYFERGLVVQKSGYVNYSWMPELTIRMAHFFIQNLGIGDGARVLDYGCAKGFFVRALRLLNVNAEGVDISAYAISQAPSDVIRYCRLIESPADAHCFSGHYDWVLVKDVFEHMTVESLKVFLIRARNHCNHAFAAIPLGRDDHSNHFVIPEYDQDVTHITVKTAEWWRNFIEAHGWRVDQFQYSFPGMKENWTKHWHNGNAFISFSPIR